jgi:dihydroorotate dehydrogenase electron transfer subunit
LKNILAKVISNKLLLTGQARYFLMRIEAPDIAATSKPGQFVMLQCGPHTVLRRPISIHSVSLSDIELFYAIPAERPQLLDQEMLGRETEVRDAKGIGTRWMSNLKKDQNISVIGPMGNGFSIEPYSSNLLLIAGGIGIAPLRFLAEYAVSINKNVTILMGAREKEGLLPTRLLPPLVRKVRYVEIGSPGRGYKRGTVLINEDLHQYYAWADQVFACGPRGMYIALDKLIRNWEGNKPVQISLEVRMGCGTGICYSCSINTKQGIKRVCKDGPVFNIKDIIWQEVII